MKLNDLDLSFITAANAETPFGGDFSFMLPMVLIFGVMYFLLFRPQQKRTKELKQMRENLKRGDRVLMNGGLYGEVSKVIGPEEVLLEVADGVKVRVATSLIGSVISGTGSSSNSTSQTTGIETLRTATPAKKSLTNRKKTAAKQKTTTKKTSAAKTSTAKKSSTVKKATAKKTTAKKSTRKKTAA